MTRGNQEKILERITEISEDLRALRKVEMDVATSGTASASLSSTGGTKSYTRLDLDKIHSLIREKEFELVNLRNRLNGQGPIRRIMFTR